MTFTLPDLPYDYNALEPHIDEQTMKVHHDKHHQSYVDKLNKAVEGIDLGNKTIQEVLSSINELPQDKQTPIINNGGGHANHSFFWEILSPNSNKQPTGNLAEAINKTFQSFDNFKEEFSNSAITKFGSGWAWLVINKNKELEITTTSNQDSPLSEGNTPILTIDLWEHAYYLKYQNRRPEYIEAFFNVINWEKAEDLFNKAN